MEDGGMILKVFGDRTMRNFAKFDIYLFWKYLELE